MYLVRLWLRPASLELLKLCKRIFTEGENEEGEKENSHV